MISIIGAGFYRLLFPLNSRIIWLKITEGIADDAKYHSKGFEILGVPQNFLIDPQGTIIARGLRGEDLEKKLAEIYKN